MKLLFAGTLVLMASAWTMNEHDLKRDQFINELNSMPERTWTAGHNERFRGLPVGAAKTLCGTKMMSEDERNFLEQQGLISRVPLYKGDDIPTEFDAVTGFPECADVIGEIRDQSACGCCWAFGAAEAASDRLCIATNAKIKVPLSAQDMCFCAERDGCNGGQLYTAWNRIQRKGLVTGGMHDGTGKMGGGWCSAFSLPHCHHHGPQGNDPYPSEGSRGCPNVSRSPRCPTSCDGDAKAPHNDFEGDKYSFDGTIDFFPTDVATIQKALMTYGPLEAAFTVYSDFENYSGGIYTHTGGSMLGGHAIRIVGWGEENGIPFWKVANSWNPYWGEEGYFRIVRGKNDCGIEGSVMANNGRAKWGKMSDLRKSSDF